MMSEGIFSNAEMIDNAVNLLNTVSVKGSENVVALSNVYQILFALKKGFAMEAESKDKTIETLKEQLKRATEQIPIEDVEIIGGKTIDLDFGGECDGNKD